MNRPRVSGNAGYVRARFGGGWGLVVGLLAAWPAGARVMEAAPLPTRESVAGPRFERVLEAESGVGFSQQVAEENPLVRLYHSGLGCGGVAAGDVNGDSRVDLYFSTGPGANRLYVQTGPWRFEDRTEAAGVGAPDRWSTGSAFADIDGDGDLDLYVCCYDAPNLLFLNDGDGRFREAAAPAGIAIADASLMPTFQDYDGDGDLDLYLLTYRLYREGGRPSEVPAFVGPDGTPRIKPEFERYYALTPLADGRVGISSYGREDHLLRNRGDGTFEDVTAAAGVAGPGHGLSAVWWDYNRDGRPDLFVGNDFDDPDCLYRNQGDGTFTNVLAEAFPQTSWFTMGATAGDLTGDGWPELLALDMAGSNHFKQKTTMGVMNVAKLAAVAGPPPQIMRNALLINSGTGRFMEGAYLVGMAASDWSWSARFLDLDLDGRLDVLISNGVVRNFTDSDVPFNTEVMIGRTQWDIYKDTEPRPERNLAFRNLGALSFEDAGEAWGLDQVGISHAVARADIDGDGDPDLVVVQGDGEVLLLRNRSSAEHRVVVRLRGARGNRFGLGATVRAEIGGLEQVRFLNPMAGFQASDEPQLHLGLGDQPRIDRLVVDWPGGGRQVFTNLPSDQVYTIAEDRQAPPRPPVTAPQPWFEQRPQLEAFRHREQAFDDFARQPLLPNRQSQYGPGMAWGDADGDGDDDLWQGGAAGQPGTLGIRQADGRMDRQVPEALRADAACEDMGGLWLDVEGDGDMDLYVVSGGVECEPDEPVLTDRLYLNDGAGGWTRAADRLPAVRDSGSCAVAADFDRDGDLDLFVGGRSVPGQYPLAARSRLLRNDGGRFVDATAESAVSLLTPELVTGAVWSDLDGDAWPDLALSIEWGPVRVFLNRQGVLQDVTARAGLDELTGWWNAVAAGDLDGDGDMDLVAGNTGLNTKYHASAEHPALLYYGDFGDGSMRIVEAEEEDERWYPVRGKSCSTLAMPFLKPRAPTYKAFAEQDLLQLYGEAPIRQARRFAASTLASVVLLNDGSGRFEVGELPMEAQLAPVFGIVIEEMTGDLWPDVVLAQNFHGPQPETGQFDGGMGCLLAGRGNGSFAMVEPAQSGLIVPGDAKSLTLVTDRATGQPGLAIGLNDEPMMMFQRAASHPWRGAEIRLAGGSGNPGGVGARVEVARTDGTVQVGEIRAGEGYLSQSPPCLRVSLPRGVEIKQVRITWPDGHQTRHPGTPGERRMLLNRGSAAAGAG